MATLQNEFTDTETVVAELAATFTEAAKNLQETAEEEPATEESAAAKQPRRKRRKHGTEFTLDD